MMKINHEEYKALKELDDDLKWITRDESGELYVYDEKPIKSETMWSYIGLHMEWIREHEHLFHFIQWEDGEPYSIQKLIHDYEYKTGTFDWATAFQNILHGESKETEVKKDVKMMNDKLEVILDELDEFITRAIGVETTSQTIEMLSGMTIEQVVEGFRDGKFDMKGELPVIPKYVTDWITKYRDKYDLYPALRLLENNTLVWGQIYEWYRTNTHKFVSAYLTGEYEVENEPLYHALIKGHEVSNSCDIYWNYDKYDNDVFVSRLYPSHDNFLTEMSKLEWNGLGINDSNADFIRV